MEQIEEGDPGTIGTEEDIIIMGDMKIVDLEEGDDAAGNMSEEDKISALPDEVLLRILSHFTRPELLHRLCLVSKRFLSLCWDPSLWTKLEIPRNLGLDLALKIISRASPRLKHLVVEKRTDDDSASASYLASVALESCNQMQRLEIICCEEVNFKFFEVIDAF